jgi:hypothetical protein
MAVSDVTQRRLAPAGDRDLSASAGKGQRNRRPHTRATAGNQSMPTGKRHLTHSLFALPKLIGHAA